jgi:hypothetical protein
MFFFGTKKKVVKSGQISNVVCLNCKENVSMWYTVQSSYFHLYWIPMFPFKKRTHVECLDCEVLVESKSFSEPIKNILQRENELKAANNPIWMFSGLIVLCVLIPLSFYQSSIADDTKLSYLNNPKVGDVYYLSLPTKYTTMKIKAVDKENIHFIINDTSVHKITKVFFINDNKYYTNQLKTYSKFELMQLLTNDSIYSINRKE